MTERIPAHSGLRDAAVLIRQLGLEPAAATEYHGPLDPVATDWLLNAEEVFVGTATPKRRREFATGRAAARQASSRLGIELGALAVGGTRQPLWPTELTGSITHTSEYVLSVVAHREQLGGCVGVDAERVKPLEPGVEGRILTTSELARLETLGHDARTVEVIKIFSAKEAFYKAQFQLTEEWVGFLDAQTTPISNGYELIVANHTVSALLQWPQPIHVVTKGSLVISGATARSAV